MSLWIPLESNPDVLTQYIRKTGVSDKWAIVDVLGLDADALEWIPKPVKAFILLFPISPAYEEHRSKENERLSADPEKYPEDLFYMRQYTQNACGTVALIHSIANNKDIALSDGVLKDFLKNAKDLTPEERGQALEKDTAFTENHQELAQQGQTAADPNEQVYHHFIALVNKDGVLYELDGRKSFPIKHGNTSNETFVRDAAKVCEEFMKRDPDDLRFTVMALVASSE